jgi:hypothetical protein
MRLKIGDTFLWGDDLLCVINTDAADKYGRPYTVHVRGTDRYGYIRVYANNAYICDAAGLCTSNNQLRKLTDFEAQIMTLGS